MWHRDPRADVHCDAHTQTHTQPHIGRYYRATDTHIYWRTIVYVMLSHSIQSSWVHCTAEKKCPKMNASHTHTYTHKHTYTHTHTYTVGESGLTVAAGSFTHHCMENGHH